MSEPSPEKQDQEPKSESKWPWWAPVVGVMSGAAAWVHRGTTDGVAQTFWTVVLVACVVLLDVWLVAVGVDSAVKHRKRQEK